MNPCIVIQLWNWPVIPSQLNMFRGDVFAHHQEHLTVFTVFASVYPICCGLVYWMSWNWVSTLPRYQMFSPIIRSTLLFTVSGSVHPSCCRLVSWMSWNWVSTLPRYQMFSPIIRSTLLFTVSGSVHPSCCRLVSWMSWNWVSVLPRYQIFSPIIRRTWLYLQYLVVFTQVATRWYLGWVETEFQFFQDTRCFRPSSGALDSIYSIW